ncbi:NucA/NucB deoxyribonuclease domain-containing protein [Actinokineospora sp. NBRC 105648]|uniref:NucA/NucB deoxyribonuclease domain-containing protein n=1 Tax=Actinokineospora sp. NBRC 105648 TaxID=3032206 RepID=UPI0024A28E87|nr:NucA/NucB deoxyribonuclease domain-containing protein [Actinokineospora sp. NBRC 105648]GLZ43205.1 hypothetical protein Acsp05_68290 [Actinokineospora sp. NBRC 105648]
MGTRTGSGLLLPVVVVATVAAVFGVGKITDTVSDILGGVADGTEIIGAGDHQIMVRSSEKTQLDDCTAKQVIAEKKCGDARVVVFDAEKMPFITRNISQAWSSGHPAVLTMNRAAETANRRAACGRFTRVHPKGSCDEYPMAATDQGGVDARTEEVPDRENSCQGGTVRWQYPRDGEDFLVVIAYPQKIADRPYWGVDIAKDPSCGV